MVQITEDYVSFETAKLLKEKGFDVYVSSFYDDEGEFSRKEADWNWNIGPRYSAPTFQRAMKWLREKHNLAIATYIARDGWHSGVSQIKLNSEGFIVDIIDGIDDGNIPNCDTYEEACEAGIKYCLENLI